MAQHGYVEPHEMRRTFNMGIGVVAIVNDKGVVSDLQARLKERHALGSYTIGKIVEGEGVKYSDGK